MTLPPDPFPAGLDAGLYALEFLAGLALVLAPVLVVAWLAVKAARWVHFRTITRWRAATYDPLRRVYRRWPWGAWTDERVRPITRRRGTAHNHNLS